MSAIADGEIDVMKIGRSIFLRRESFKRLFEHCYAA
mgnify:CR=1 FL=1